MLVNLRPTTDVELHVIVEECAERLSDAECASVLALVHDVLGPRPEYHRDEDDGDDEEGDGQMPEAAAR